MSNCTLENILAVLENFDLRIILAQGRLPLVWNRTSSPKSGPFLDRERLLQLEPALFRGMIRTRFERLLDRPERVPQERRRFGQPASGSRRISPGYPFCGRMQSGGPLRRIAACPIWRPFMRNSTTRPVPVKCNVRDIRWRQGSARTARWREVARTVSIPIPAIRRLESRIRDIAAKLSVA